MSKALRNIYHSVSNVELEGMNSTNLAQVNFVASPHGITQVFKGTDPKEISQPHLKRLPDIKMDQ